MKVASVRLPLLKEYREAKGWTYTMLADTAQVSRETAKKAETDLVTRHTARKLAAAMDVSPEILAGQKTFLQELHMPPP